MSSTHATTSRSRLRKASPFRTAPEGETCLLRLALTQADVYRENVRNEIYDLKDIHLYPFSTEDEIEQKELAGKELTRFAAVMTGMPIMEKYFDRRHLSNMRNHLDEATHAFTRMSSGIIMEIIIIPAMDNNVMGFHLFNAFDPKDNSNTQGTLVGYSIYTIFFHRDESTGASSFKQADKVGLAFDIFIPYRGDHQTNLHFDRHELYNASRRILVGCVRPPLFTVDAKTQIRETWTGDPVKRCGYYLKRGYYPPDQKALADRYLTEVILKNKKLSPRQVSMLFQRSKSTEWIFPTGR